MFFRYLCIKITTTMKLLSMILPAIMLMACSSGAADKSAKAAAQAETAETPKWPAFNADSAFAFTARQVDFGPRVPGTPAHRQCRDYLTEKLAGYGADTVMVQEATVTAFDGTRLPMANIMARFNAKAPRRILLAAHYDTRPWADEDKDESKRRTPLDGANDGASGVAVILEIARNLQQQAPGIGVDVLLTDVEDYGSHDDESTGESSWALGAQYWAAHTPYTSARQRPAYGILLDMVGGRNASFCREYLSESVAPVVNSKVWQAARAEGISRFVDEQRGGVTDDHIFINRAGIPCIDIIECANPETGSFPPTWHTTDDNIKNIDPSTLGDVGRTLMRVIYTESPQ